MKKDNKDRLFEVMGKLDKTFKPILNESDDSFKDRERNAGVEPEDKSQIKKDMNNYVKVGNTFMKLIYYKPYMGATDGKLYTKKGNEYV